MSMNVSHLSKTAGVFVPCKLVSCGGGNCEVDVRCKELAGAYQGPMIQNFLHPQFMDSRAKLECYLV